MKQFRKFIRKLNTIALTAFAIGILIVLNYSLFFFPFRLDLTENKIYSLSSATTDILRKLNKKVTVRLYFSDDLPNRLLPTKKEVESLLAEYERVGGNKLNLDVVVVDTQEKEQEAASKGVPPLQFSDIEKDKLQVSKGFFGGVVQVASEEAAIPVFEEGENFEYQFTSAINKLTRDEVPAVAFTTGHGESAQVRIARELLRKDFDVRTKNLAIEGGEEFDFELLGNIKTLIVIGSSQEWNEEEKAVLTEFVESGGSVLFALDGVEVGQGLFASPIEHNLNDWFEGYGLKLNSDLVVSASNDIATFQTPQGGFIAPYPFWVRIRPDGFNKDVAELAQLETAVFPWASSVGKPTRSKLKAQSSIKEEIEVFDLIKSVPESYSVEEEFNLSPDQEFSSLAEGGTGQKTIAAAAEINGDGSKVVLIGDADFVQDNYLQRARENAVLFLNLIDWLASDGALSSIRARESSFRPIVELSEPAKSAVKYGSVIVVPILLTLLGLLRKYKR